MFRLVESVRIQDGVAHHLEYHQKRMNQARKDLLGLDRELVLSDIIKPQGQSGIVKCRIVYEKEILDIRYEQYHRKAIRSLKAVRTAGIDYGYKYEDRSALQKLFDQRGAADNILIIHNGWVGDSFSANVVFFDGRYWYTPDTPLLQGTTRARLLEQGMIREAPIGEKDIMGFQKLRFINAMIDFDEWADLETDKIIIE